MSKEYEGPMLPYICNGCKYIAEKQLTGNSCGSKKRSILPSYKMKYCTHELMGEQALLIFKPNETGAKIMTPRRCPFLNK